MYADREETEANRSIKERLNGNSATASGLRRTISGKRRREDDDKWQHDLFADDEPQVSYSRVGAKDLRLKLQKKSIQPARQNRDLREKLSGTLCSYHIESGKPPLRINSALEASEPLRNSFINESHDGETKKIASFVSKKKTQQKVETVDSFLQSMDLEKYSIMLEAEEVDMTVLIHMRDEDLKALGIPMGPRKKILVALESKV